uniref:Uncharacterized protein n=1 Tax=Alexandrium monilatum TaxID=311494 RepID=A0A7S4WCK3_9DINO
MDRELFARRACQGRRASAASAASGAPSQGRRQGSPPWPARSRSNGEHVAASPSRPSEEHRERSKRHSESRHRSWRSSGAASHRHRSSSRHAEREKAEGRREEEEQEDDRREAGSPHRRSSREGGEERRPGRERSASERERRRRRRAPRAAGEAPEEEAERREARRRRREERRRESETRQQRAEEPTLRAPELTWLFSSQDEAAKPSQTLEQIRLTREGLRRFLDSGFSASCSQPASSRQGDCHGLLPQAEGEHRMLPRRSETPLRREPEPRQQPQAQQPPPPCFGRRSSDPGAWTSAAGCLRQRLCQTGPRHERPVPARTAALGAAALPGGSRGKGAERPVTGAGSGRSKG